MHYIGRTTLLNSIVLYQPQYVSLGAGRVFDLRGLKSKRTGAALTLLVAEFLSSIRKYL